MLIQYSHQSFDAASYWWIFRDLHDKASNGAVDRTAEVREAFDVLEREFEGLRPDILLAGVNGSRLGLYDYDRRLLTVTGFPRIVIPTHWDNFRLPYGFSQEPNMQRNIYPFIETVAELSPRTTVIPPVHLETFTVR